MCVFVCVCVCRKAVIATGGSAAVPPIPGLAEAPYLTNASLFNLTDLPKRIIVMGAGPIGLEMAQSFRRFGSEVVVLNRGGKVLPKEDADAAAVVQKALERLVVNGTQAHTRDMYVCGVRVA